MGTPAMASSYVRDGLVGEYHANSLSLANGANVTLWNDESGMGNHLDNTATNKPTWDASMHAVRFTASGLTLIQKISPALGSPSGLTIQLVGAMHGSSFPQTPVNLIGTGQGFQLRVITTNRPQAFVTAPTKVMSSSVLYSADTLYGWSMRVRNSDGRVDFQNVGGDTSAAEVPAQFFSTPFTTASTFRLGDSAAGASPFNGWVKHLLIYNRRLSDSELLANENHFRLIETLGDLFGLTPVGLAAPSDLYITNEDATSCVLNWVDNALTETGFRVQYRIEGGSWTDADDAGTPITDDGSSNITDDGSTYISADKQPNPTPPDRTYWGFLKSTFGSANWVEFRVRAEQGVLTSSWSDVLTLTLSGITDDGNQPITDDGSTIIKP